jgi:hypothetical protein
MRRASICGKGLDATIEDINVGYLRSGGFRAMFSQEWRSINRWNINE